MDDRRDLEQLRRDARDELDVVIDIRCRRGEDPWDFLPDLPSVDEQVVATLREDAEMVDHPRAGESAVDRDYRLLRGIALDHPELTRAVWALVARIDGIDDPGAGRR